jgi:hypothetical protein
MSTQDTIRKLRAYPGKQWTTATVIEWLESAQAEAKRAPKAEREPPMKSGPGNAAWPCECGRGALAFQANRPYKDGALVRYRHCKACKRKAVTEERIVRAPGPRFGKPTVLDTDATRG